MVVKHNNALLAGLMKLRHGKGKAIYECEWCVVHLSPILCSMPEPDELLGPEFFEGVWDGNIFYHM